MNKTAIKNFAVWARRKLIGEITDKARLLGVTETGVAEALPQSTKDLQFFDIGTKKYAEVQGTEIAQRNALVAAVRGKAQELSYKDAFQNVVEEIAYTWFNRMIAIRFMEVNDYLPSRVRVLSSETAGKLEPDFVTTPFDTDLDFTPYERDRVMQLKDENKLDELFRALFIKQCNKLHEILPELFEATSDYTELLLTISFTDKDGVVYHLTHDIPESDFDIEHTDEDGKTPGQVEIIGWMYQYYNTEPKDQVFANLKKNIKISKENIPAATQLFTPDWIVRYMVENSLGRTYIEWSVESGEWSEGERSAKEKEIAERMGWKYYLPEAEQTPEVRKKLHSQLSTLHTDFQVTDLKIIDPCMGSGHILVYAFEVLMQIYEAQGYTQRDAARLIVEKNLYGLDIDKRAYQLAYFAVMMKARQYNRRILNGEVKPNLFAIDDSSAMTRDVMDFIANGDKKMRADLQSIADDLMDAKEYGSIINVAPVDFDAIYARIEEIRGSIADDLFAASYQKIAVETVLPLVKQAQVMAQKYSVTCTNPPYMGSSGMSAKLSEFVKREYPDSKSDLFAVFIERCGAMTAKNGFQAMITQHAWMFLSSFEKLRGKLLNTDIVNMAHLGARAFEEIGGEVVQTTSFVMRKSHIADYKGTYCRLIEPTSQQGKEDMFIAGENRYAADQTNFSKIPGSPVAYWVSEKLLGVFAEKYRVSDYGMALQGSITGDNERFLRLWFEVDYGCIKFDSCSGKETYLARWYPHNKGGGYRKWYGNFEYVINWRDDGYEIRNFVDSKGKLKSRPQNTQHFFKKGISWSDLTMGNFGARYVPTGFTFNVSGPTFVPNSSDYIFWCLGYFNSPVFQALLDICCQGLHYHNGIIAGLPVPMQQSTLNELVEETVDGARSDWDSYETSWDFKRNPMLNRGKLADAYTAWKADCESRFLQLKTNEEELNRIFIDIYGLQDELTPDVADKDVTVHRVFDSKDDVPESMKGSNYIRTMHDEIVSLISYAVGCMFGRYSLDEDGIVYAGGDFNQKYCRWIAHLGEEKVNELVDENGQLARGAAWAGCSMHPYDGIRKDGRWTEASFPPDTDNCIPITDEEYFQDDIVGRFVEFIRTVYGNDTLEENLDFIAKALGNKGNTSREIIRNYFLTDFIRDHIKTYQKRPIYWMFDSGKQNGFKALVYMHRWNADTTGNVRVEYLHRIQRVYESEMNRMQDIVENSGNAREISAAQKRKDKLSKQLKESKDYDAKIAHLALSRIDIDLDDGVKVNYEKVQTGQDGKRIEILTAIK